jgi:hypothetical protein
MLLDIKKSKSEMWHLNWLPCVQHYPNTTIKLGKDHHIFLIIIQVILGLVRSIKSHQNNNHVI